MREGRSIVLFGDTDTGKTTLAEEYAKHIKRTEGLDTVYNFADKGGYGGFKRLERAKVAKVNAIKEGDDPWIWLADAANGKGVDKNTGLVIIDSGTAAGERIMDWITKDPRQIGQQKTQKFTVTARDNTSLVVGANNESHYGLVQSFGRDMMWRSTWLTDQGIDVLWTFGLWRGEGADGSQKLGPLFVGKALTGVLPKWFKHVFPLVTVPTNPGEAPKHVLYLQEQPEFGGTGMMFANARYPLDADTPLPVMIEPASLVGALTCIQIGEAESEAKMIAEFGGGQ